MIDLEGRVALITGAASGIGAATGECFARMGARVALGYYAADPYPIDPVIERAEALGGRALALPVDVTNAASVDHAVQRAGDALGGVDIVVASAGIARRVPATDLTDERWRHTLDVNLLGAFRCFRAALPGMIDRGYGRLLAVSSIAGHVQGWSEHAHYTASKGGLDGLVRGLAHELAPRGITVNAVARGVVVSPQSSDPVNSLGPEGLNRVRARVPVGRNGRPQDVATALLYLASESACFVTGQILLVDGGLSLVTD